MERVQRPPALGVRPSADRQHQHGLVQYRRRPARSRQARELRPRLRPGCAEPQHRPFDPKPFRSSLRRPAVWENPREVVPASDVYSLGLVYYQLITGQPPRHDVEAVLAGKGPAIDSELLAKELSRNDSPNLMSDPAGAAEIIGRMCAPQRSDPYATLVEAMEDLAICEASPGTPA